MSGVALARNGGTAEERMVEAAGVEPDHIRSTNWLMAHGFRRITLILRRFPPSTESPGVPCSPPESTPAVEIVWRRLSRTNSLGEWFIS
jgi:hypothetical protein